MSIDIIKKAAGAALTAVIIFSLAACSYSKKSSAETEASSTVESRQENADGKWEVTTGELSIDHHTAAKTAFEKATEELVGYEYEAIALLGQQVVAGTNYSIFAKGRALVPDAEPEFVVVTVYEDLEGKAEIIGTKTLMGGDAEEMTGGFTVNDQAYQLDKQPEVRAVFDKALDGLVGADYELVAYLGSQVVSGTNYLALARITPVTPEAVPEIALVTVYESLEGGAEILETETLALGTEAS